MAFDSVGGNLEQVSEAKIKEGARPLKQVWVVVVTKPNQERRAKRELEQQGFEVYLPMRLAMNRRTKAVVALPFFPRYMFARVGLAIHEWSKIWYTFGVHGLLGSAEQPIGVKDELIERLRIQEEAGFIKIGLEAEGPQFEVGERVRTIDEFGFEGVFAERVDDKRVVIVVSF
jgi:transcriptional antiterminator RfaH